MTNLKFGSASLRELSQDGGDYGYQNITNDIANPEFVQENQTTGIAKDAKENIIQQSVLSATIQSELKGNARSRIDGMAIDDTIFICPRPKKSANMVEKIIASNSTQNVCEDYSINITSEQNSCMEKLKSKGAIKSKSISVVQSKKTNPAKNENLAGDSVTAIEESANALIEAYRNGKEVKKLEQAEDKLDLQYLNSLHQIGEGDYTIGADGKKVYTDKSITKVQQKLNERLEKASDEYIESLERAGVVEPGVLGYAYVDSASYETILADDECENLSNTATRTKGCLLCNVKLDRSEAKVWGSEEWVKFFLKSAKSMQFSIDYYDKLIDRHANCSFYYSHVEKYGSMENFYETIVDIISRKATMIELKAFVKRLYKELTALEIMIVDKFIFGADNVDEITSHVSLRTMYRMADRIVIKLIEFMNARGYTPQWCYKNFSVIL